MTGSARLPVDPADEAMVARAHERFAGDRKRRRPRSGGALPNLVVIGGLKCGTTSLHHYLNLHPKVGMSKPKELNFFVEGLNWGLGPPGTPPASRPDAEIRGETSPHYTNRPRFEGVAARMRETLGPEANLIYMVRDPIKRLLSHYVHNSGAGYETRPLAEAVAGAESSYVQRGLYAFQLEPYLEAFDRERILIVAQEEFGAQREATMRRCSTSRRRGGVHIGAVRARMGDRRRARGRRRLPADGPRRPAARAAGARPQLRPDARSACAGWSSGSSTTRDRGRAPSRSCPRAIASA